MRWKAIILGMVVVLTLMLDSCNKEQDTKTNREAQQEESAKKLRKGKFKPSSGKAWW